jgi:hypothetical protein
MAGRSSTRRNGGSVVILTRRDWLATGSMVHEGCSESEVQGNKDFAEGLVSGLFVDLRFVGAYI